VLLPSRGLGPLHVLSCRSWSSTARTCYCNPGPGSAQQRPHSSLEACCPRTCRGRCCWRCYRPSFQSGQVAARSEVQSNGTHVLLPSRDLGPRNNGPTASWVRAARVLVVVVAAGAAAGPQSNPVVLLHDLPCKSRLPRTEAFQGSDRSTHVPRANRIRAIGASDIAVEAGAVLAMPRSCQVDVPPAPCHATPPQPARRSYNCRPVVGWERPRTRSLKNTRCLRRSYGRRW
jgi:hypothetical protein